MTCWRTNDDFKAKHSRWLLLNRHWSGRSCPWCCPWNVARTTFARSVLSSHPFSNRQYKQLPSPSITYWKDKDGSLKIDAVKKGNRQSSPREWDGNKKCDRWGLLEMPNIFDDEWFVSFGDGNTGPKKWSAQWYPVDCWQESCIHDHGYTWMQLNCFCTF